MSRIARNRVTESPYFYAAMAAGMVLWGAATEQGGRAAPLKAVLLAGAALGAFAAVMAAHYAARALELRAALAQHQKSSEAFKELAAVAERALEREGKLIAENARQRRQLDDLRA